MTQTSADTASMNASILLVEDHETTRQTLVQYLERAGYRVDALADGREGLEKALTQRYDLIVLDLMLPGLDGREFCKRLRQSSSVPVIMLTALAGESDLVKGFRLGADDYIRKPFSPAELMARIEARLHRGTAVQDYVTFGDLRLDRAGKRWLLGGQELPLTRTEFLIAETLAQAPGRVFSREELIERVFGFDYEGTTKNIDMHISRIRRHMAEDLKAPQYIQTVVGLGYRFNSNLSRGKEAAP